MEKGRPQLPATRPRKGSHDADRIQGSRHPGRRRTAQHTGMRLERRSSSSSRRPPTSRSSNYSRRVGIGPGKFPVNNAKLSAGTIAGLRAAVAAGPGQVTKELTEMFHAGFTAHNGWLVAAGRKLRHQLLAEGDSRQDRTRRAAAEHRDLPDRADRTRRPSAQRRQHALRGTLPGE